MGNGTGGDAKRSHGQLQASAAGDSDGRSRSADAARGHGHKKGLSRDMIPFVVLAAAGVVLSLTTCVAVVSWRRCRAKNARSLQSDAARVEQGEAGQGCVAEGVAATGVPVDGNVVVTGIPVSGEGASAAGKV